ncbi:MAG: thioredoxin fold domain-containing protein [Bacteroidia bacterium]|nr:thioredoxin fold domain-containing protein [Bacteroidia bacterium]
MKPLFFAILCVTAFMFVSISANAQQFNFQTDAYENMIAKAKEENKPFMIYFSFKECGVCNQLEKETFTSTELQQYLSENLTCYKVDAFSFEGIGITQLLSVNQFPSIIFFNTYGERAGTMKGFYTPEGFMTETSRIIEVAAAQGEIAVSIEVPEIQVVSPVLNEEEYQEKLNTVMRNAEEVSETTVDIVQTFEKELASHTAENMEMEMDAEAFDKMDANLFIFSDVPGVKQYSVKDKKPSGYALRVGQFKTLEAVKSELKEYEKGWKAEIWVYTQSRANSKIYCLALGLYDDKEQAYYMRKLLYNNFFYQGTVVRLDDIRYEK